MGYTHYFGFSKRTCSQRDYQAALDVCAKMLKDYNKGLKDIDDKHPNRLSGYTVHAPIGSYAGLEVNGTKDLGHETFVLPQTYARGFSGFCKTNRKPYDIAVVAVLCVMKHMLGDRFIVDADGRAYDYHDGLTLARELTGLNIANPLGLYVAKEGA